MQSKIHTANLNFLVFTLAILSLIVTPGLSADATVLPKLLTLTILIGNFLPLIILNFRTYLINTESKTVLVISLLIILQLILVIINSDAPITQQFFGRPYRMIGLITYLSVILLFLLAYKIFESNHIDILLKTLAFCGLISSVYTCLQTLNIDFENSSTSTISGTFGVTNFQSAFTAMALVPSIYLAINKKLNKSVIPIVALFYIFTIYSTKSIQGYIGLLIGLSILSLIYLSKNRRKIAYLFAFFNTILFTIVVAGMLGRGYFSHYLYKDSVQSRGDFWRSSIRMANDHPFFGVGLDSYPDFYFRYKDRVSANRSWYENSDSSHNYFLDFASQGGYPLAIFFGFIVLWVAYRILRFTLRNKEFDLRASALFATWFVSQAMSLINPISIPLFTLNLILSAVIIKITGKKDTDIDMQLFNFKSHYKSPFSFIRLLASGFSILVLVPVISADRYYLKIIVSQDFEKIEEFSSEFPESAIKYRELTKKLLLSNQFDKALNVSRRAVKFNPNDAAGWALILINSSASIEERTRARDEVFRLDPLNKQFKDYKITSLG